MRRNSKGKAPAPTAASRGARKKSKVDRISELPDDILISIISRLTLQEAIFTSILSTRWRHLYTHITRLDFQPLKPLIPPKDINLDALIPCPRRVLQFQPMKTPQEFSMRVDWINNVFDSYNESRFLKEIRLRVPRPSQVDIDNWLEFALSRDIETLHVHIEKFLFVGHHTYSLEKLILKSNSLVGFTSLKTLSLCKMELHNRELELLISNCNALERLSITFCRVLGDLVIIGWPELKLKHLEIDHFSSFVQICDLTSLVTFRYCGLGIRLAVKNVPMLSLLDIDEMVYDSHMERLARLLCCSIQGLVKLTLGINPLDIKDCGWSCNLAKLINLKHMVLRVKMKGGSCILPLTPLIDASPFLEKLEIKFSWHLPDFRNRDILDRDLKKHPHYNLKTVKFYGYLGSPHESEFAFYIFKNAVNLKEFVIESYNKTWIMSRKLRKEATLARRQFQVNVPKSVKLVID